MSASIEVRAHLSALLVSLVRDGDVEAAASLWDWAQDNLDLLEQDFDTYAELVENLDA